MPKKTAAFLPPPAPHKHQGKCCRNPASSSKADRLLEKEGAADACGVGTWPGVRPVVGRGDSGQGSEGLGSSSGRAVAGRVEGKERQVPLSVQGPGSWEKWNCNLPEMVGKRTDTPGMSQDAAPPQTPAAALRARLSQLLSCDEILPSKQDRETWEAAFYFQKAKHLKCLKIYKMEKYTPHGMHRKFYPLQKGKTFIFRLSIIPRSVRVESQVE